MKSFLLAFVEGYGISVAITLAEHGYHWAGYVVGIAVMSLAYHDGRLGWSE